MENPYRSPATFPEDEENDRRPLEGIGRVSHVAITLIFFVLSDLAANQLLARGRNLDLVEPAFWIVLIAPTYFRFKNIGMNPWWSGCVLIPFLNFLVLWRAFVFQEGYTRTRKLDQGGKIFMALLVGAFALIAVYISLRK